MKTLWLSKEPVTVWFDNKPICDVLEQENLPSSVEVEISDAHYNTYMKALEEFNKWQKYFAHLVKMEKLIK